jgi:flagellum-specific ATP synthase
MGASPMISLDRYVARAQNAAGPSVEGRVHKSLGLLVEVAGMTAAIGSELEVEAHGRRLVLEVFGFRDGNLLTAPLGSTAGVEPGAWVRARRGAQVIACGDALLGRVIDAFGNPIDGAPPPHVHEHADLQAPAPHAFTRRAIDTPIETRVRAIDALLPLGNGQRVGLFAGSGVGKSTLLGMLCRHTQADVIVVGLIGERGREVGDFVRTTLGPEGLARSVVVVATSDAPPFVRVRGAYTATAIAEHFRDRGKNVLLVMDSVTRFAMALRESSLAAGEPPVSKGYTPSVFAALPVLLERAGTSSHEGSITAIYTVLVEGDDMNDPIADAVRGILDGHIVLSRKLADRGVFPAIDVLRSISRVAPDIVEPAHLRAVADVRGLLATYADAVDLIQIGAYAAGSDPRVDMAVRLMPQIEALVRQGLRDDVPRSTALAALAAIVAAAR